MAAGTWTIKVKLLGGMALMSLALIVAVGVGLRNMRTVGDHLDSATSTLLPSAVGLDKMREGWLSSVVMTREGLLAVRDGDASGVRQASAGREAALQRLVEGRRIYEPLPQSPDEARVWQSLLAAIPPWRDAQNQVWAQIDAGHYEQARQLQQTLLTQHNRTGQDALERLMELQVTNGQVAARESTAIQGSARTAQLTAALFGLLIAVVITILFFRAVIEPLEKIKTIATRIAVGDVDQTVDYASGDEIGQLADAFREMVKYIRDVAGAAAAIGRGDLDFKLTARSEQDMLSKNFLQAASVLRSMVVAERDVVNAAREGKLSVRADTSTMNGVYAELVQGVNQVMDATMKPIQESLVVLEKLASSDLTTRMQGEYKGDFARLQTSLNAAVDTLHDSLAQVATASEQVAAAVTQIAAGSQAIAQGASTQASALQQTTASLEEMSAMTRQTAGHAQEANTLSQTSRAATTQGRSAMVEMSGAMTRIRAAAEGTAAIIRDINEIAFQTNLLALNAAVEAARAGDAGRGFAVVAEEVRNLAQRAKEAAKKTEALITESVSHAQHGESTARMVETNLTAIDDSVTRVTGLVSQIATASSEQSRGIDQVNKATSDMDRVTQNNAANAEESASAAEELSAQARELSGLVGQFRLRSSGTFRAPRATAAHNAKPAVRALPGRTPAASAPVATRARRGSANSAEEAFPMDDSAGLKDF
ncbi:MAG: methyl-accepting chemotaxis protein [Deltaproteobacteria bacterium]